MTLKSDGYENIQFVAGKSLNVPVDSYQRLDISSSRLHDPNLYRQHFTPGYPPTTASIPTKSMDDDVSKNSKKDTRKSSPTEPPFPDTTYKRTSRDDNIDEDGG